jgi:hypothetical protein
VRKLCDGLDRLESDGVELTEELKKARAEMRAAMVNSTKNGTNEQRLYNYKNCLSVGDVWIHLESIASNIKDFASTNYRESQHLCSLLGLNLHDPMAESRRNREAK